MAKFSTVGLMLFGCVALTSPVRAAIDAPPVPMPAWWGLSHGQTASLYADFSSPGLLWDESRVGADLDVLSFFIETVNMSWVDDPDLGKGYQADAARGEMIFTYDNLMVLTNRKTLVDILEISTEDIERVGKPIVEAVWGASGWDPGGAVGGIQTSWEWEHKQGNTWLLKINSVLTPQPDKVRIRLPVIGGSGPVIHRSWTGENCSPVPEPSTPALTASFCIAGLILSRRYKRRLKVSAVSRFEA